MIFRRVGPLEMKNNSLWVKIEGLFFSPNNYDTASQAKVFIKTINQPG